MNFKRKKSRRQVKCTICTTHRWKGNAAGRRSDLVMSDRRDGQKIKRDVQAQLT